MKELIRKFEHIEISFHEKEKIREFDSNGVKVNRIFYKQINVSEINSLQSAISRSESKNKSKKREYRENRDREDEISHEKTKRFKNSSFIKFFKIECHRCRKNECYTRNCIEFEFVKKSKKE